MTRKAQYAMSTAAQTAALPLAGALSTDAAAAAGGARSLVVPGAAVATDAGAEAAAVAA